VSTAAPARAEANKSSRSIAWRVGITAIALVIWFWTQSLIGSRRLGGTGIGDGLHSWLTPLNAYLGGHSAVANALLIGSSAIIDLLGIFLLGSWIMGRGVRPFLGLVILLGLRQIMQALVALPAPPNAIWHYPGFPSLLVTYGVANDYFFSGHTAIAVFAATELARLKIRWLAVLSWSVVVFEIVTVLALRAHYTMDVFTGLVAALWVGALLDKISPSVDRRT
jgi:hypothetical protein